MDVSAQNSTKFAFGADFVHNMTRLVSISKFYGRDLFMMQIDPNVAKVEDAAAPPTAGSPLRYDNTSEGALIESGLRT